MSEPVAGHTAEQRPPADNIQHPGTTPVPVFVPEEPAGTLTWKGAQLTKVLQEAFSEAKKIDGFPQIRDVLTGDLYWKKETRWSTGDEALLSLAAEVQLLAKLLADPGVRRLAELLRGGREAA